MKAFDHVRDAIPAELHPVIEAYIHANSGWNDEAAALAQCEWELVKPLFDGLKREEFNLGKATLDFYDEREAELLTSDEQDYLKRLRDIKRTEAQDEDEDFYRHHRNELKEHPPLKLEMGPFRLRYAGGDGRLSSGTRALPAMAVRRGFHVHQAPPHDTVDRRTKKDLRDLN